MDNDRRLAIDTFTEKSKHLIEMKEKFPNKRNWIFTIKSLLGMSSKQLAKRLGVANPSVSKAFNHENEGSITIKRLEKYADALGCDLVYAFVPRRSISELIYDEAYRKAKAILNKSSLMMELEDQAVESSDELANQLESLAAEIKNNKHLWD